MKYKNSPPKANKAAEPLAVYTRSINKFTHLRAILGGTNVQLEDLNDDMDLIRLSRSGLPKRTLQYLAAKMNISMEKLSNLLHISHRTLQRKEADDVLSLHVSEHILALAEVVRRAIEVLGSEPAMEQWLHSNLPSLESQKPIDYLDTSFGTQLILKTLGRLEHGVY